MKTIRRNVFETNSSSTHSICICTDEEYTAWKNNNIFWNKYEKAFISKEDLIKQLREEDSPLGTDEEILQEVLSRPYEYEVETLGSWGDDLETDYTSYVTPKGEKIHILCAYGYNY